MEKLESMFKLLSDSNRLAMFIMLMDDEYCVCDIERFLQLKQANVSKHLRAFRALDLLEGRKEHKWTHYTLSSRARREHEKLFEYVRSSTMYASMKKKLQTFEKDSCRPKAKKKRVAFVCIHNSCRSQMAEAWAKTLGGDVMDAYSAGTEDYPEVKPLAVEVMAEAGIDMSGQHPKKLEDIPESFDILVTMGCNVACPHVPTKHREDWDIEDPSGSPVEAYRETRNLIKEKVLELIERIKKGEL